MCTHAHTYTYTHARVHPPTHTRRRTCTHARPPDTERESGRETEDFRLVVGDSRAQHVQGLRIYSKALEGSKYPIISYTLRNSNRHNCYPKPEYLNYWVLWILSR